MRDLTPERDLQRGVRHFSVATPGGDGAVAVRISPASHHAPADPECTSGAIFLYTAGTGPRWSKDLVIAARRMGAQPRDTTHDVEEMAKGKPPMTRMRDMTGCSQSVYTWILSFENVAREAHRLAAVACRRRTLLITCREGKHKSVAMAEAVAAVLRQRGEHVEIFHASLLSRPPKFHPPPHVTFPVPVLASDRDGPFDTDRVGYDTDSDHESAYWKRR